MNSDVRERLILLVTEFHAQCAQDKWNQLLVEHKFWYAILKDYAANREAEVFVLSKAVQLGVVEGIDRELSLGETTFTAVRAVFVNYSEVMIHACALQPDAALWAVKSWMMALESARRSENRLAGSLPDGSLTPIPQPPPIPTPQPPKSTAGPHPSRPPSASPLVPAPMPVDKFIGAQPGDRAVDNESHQGKKSGNAIVQNILRHLSAWLARFRSKKIAVGARSFPVFMLFLAVLVPAVAGVLIVLTFFELRQPPQVLNTSFTVGSQRTIDEIQGLVGWTKARIDHELSLRRQLFKKGSFVFDIADLSGVTDTGGKELWAKFTHGKASFPAGDIRSLYYTLTIDNNLVNVALPKGAMCIIFRRPDGRYHMDQYSYKPFKKGLNIFSQCSRLININNSKKFAESPSWAVTIPIDKPSLSEREARPLGPDPGSSFLRSGTWSILTEIWIDMEGIDYPNVDGIRLSGPSYEFEIKKGE
jgi:hypothetical protein